MNVIDADDIAKRLGVSRRSVISAAAAAGGVEYLGNKAYLRAARLQDSLGEWYDLLAPDAHRKIPVHGKQMTLQQVADRIGCSRSTVLRVIGRTGLGVVVGGRRYVPEHQIAKIEQSVLPRGVTRIHKNKKAMSDRGKRMARARWGK